MSSFHFRKWSSTPVVTNNLKLTTKLQNFDSYSSRKSILGYIINLTDSALSDTYHLNVYFRTIENGPWGYGGHINSTNTSYGTRNFKKMFTIPIKNVTDFQFQIKGRTTGTVAINDITILYRKVRDITESNL